MSPRRRAATERMSAWGCEGPWVQHQLHPPQSIGYNVLRCSRGWPPTGQKQSQCSEQARQGRWDLGRPPTLPSGHPCSVGQCDTCCHSNYPCPGRISSYLCYANSHACFGCYFTSRQHVLRYPISSCYVFTPKVWTCSRMVLSVKT